MKKGSSKKIGQKFGRLLVLETSAKYFNNRRYTYYKCKCDCGNEVVTQLNKAIQSCGCKQKEDLIARSRKELGFAAKTAVWNYYKRNAFTRNLEWNLTREEFEILVYSNCHYCGVDPNSLWETPEGSKVIKSGVDRKDNTKGYSVDNCVACCKICNRAKGTLPEEVYLEWIIQMRGNPLRR